MHKKQSKKPLLLWMDEGDRDLVPVMMGNAMDTAATYFGLSSRTDDPSVRDARNAVPSQEIILRCREETGIQIH